MTLADVRRRMELAVHIEVGTARRAWRRYWQGGEDYYHSLAYRDALAAIERARLSRWIATGKPGSVAYERRMDRDSRVAFTGAAAMLAARNNTKEGTYR